MTNNFQISVCLFVLDTAFQKSHVTIHMSVPEILILYVIDTEVSLMPRKLLSS